MTTGTPVRMPVLFVGHGSPMNAIEDNAWSRGFRALAARLPRPRAILSVSAHWFVPGTFVGANERPETIHDFAGFPPALHAVRYPASGDVGLARRVVELLADERHDVLGEAIRLPLAVDIGVQTVNSLEPYIGHIRVGIRAQCGRTENRDYKAEADGKQQYRSRRQYRAPQPGHYCRGIAYPSDPKNDFEVQRERGKAKGREGVSENRVLKLQHRSAAEPAPM